MIAGDSRATPIPLDRDVFMRRLIASLGHLNEGLLGSDVAGAYVMNVGLSMGAAIEEEYKRFWGIERPFTLDEYAHVIVDLKQKIQGNFSLVSNAPEKVVVRTTSCPFDAFVRQSPSLCFMTSSVFGGIAARNFGYAKVALNKRIALGDDGCYVTIHLQQTPEAEASIGREYYPDIDAASPDIAEQLRLMDRLRTLRSELGEIRSRWDEVINSAAEAIAAIDAAGRIELANARWRELLGVEGAELIGGRFTVLVHPDDRDRADGLLRRMLAGERVVGQDLQVTHRDGSWRAAAVSGGPVRDELGHIMGALVIARDVTAEREAQRVKDQFLAMASHELRTPIASVKGMAQMLQLTVQRYGGIDPAKLSERLQALVREADRLAMLSRDLLDASRLQTSTIRIDVSPDELNAITRTCVERHVLVAASGSSGIELRFRPAAGPVPVLVDRERIEQVLDNLISNAIKYSPGGDPVDVTVVMRGEEACVSVSDNGIGIPATDLDKLFTPFTRASNASASSFPGLGLGLHLVKVIVEAHGGRMTLDSTEGVGTTATVVLPLDQGHSHAAG